MAGVAAIREAVDINICASLGIADRAFLADLKAAGLKRFHHNLEAAPSFSRKFAPPTRSKTGWPPSRRPRPRDWKVCVGGIAGLGESLAQRC